MSTEQRIDPELTVMLDEVAERLKAQVDPEGQEYTYRVAWETPDGVRGNTNALADLDAVGAASNLGRNTEDWTVWVERALLGTWERVR